MTNSTGSPSNMQREGNDTGEGKGDGKSEGKGNGKSEGKGYGDKGKPVNGENGPSSGEHGSKGGLVSSGSKGQARKGKLGLDDGSDLPSMPKGGVGGGGCAEYEKGGARDRRPQEKGSGDKGKGKDGKDDGKGKDSKGKDGKGKDGKGKDGKGKDGKDGKGNEDCKGAFAKDNGKGPGKNGDYHGKGPDDDGRMSLPAYRRDRPYDPEEARNLSRIFEGKGKFYDFGNRYPPRDFYKDTYHFSRLEMEEWLEMEENKELMSENLITFVWGEENTIHGRYHCALCPSNVLENWGCLSGHISGGTHNKRLRYHRQPYGGPPLLDDDVAMIPMPEIAGSAGPPNLRSLLEFFHKQGVETAHDRAPPLPSGHTTSDYPQPSVTPTNPRPYYASVNLNDHMFFGAPPPPVFPGADGAAPPPLPGAGTSLIQELNNLQSASAPPVAPPLPSHRQHEQTYEAPPPPGAYAARLGDPTAVLPNGPDVAAAGQQAENAYEPPPPPGAYEARVAQQVHDNARQQESALGGDAFPIPPFGNGGVVEGIPPPTPAASEPLPTPEAAETNADLQPGWERIEDDDGNEYYHRGSDAKLQWGKPTLGLPPDWSEFVDTTTGKPYFENCVTKNVQWIFPVF